MSLVAVAARATRHAGHNTSRTTTASVERGARSEREPVEAKPRLGLHVAGHADRREGRKEECGDHRDGRGEQPDGRGAENRQPHEVTATHPERPQGRVATRLDPGLSGEHRAEHGDQRERGEHGKQRERDDLRANRALEPDILVGLAERDEGTDPSRFDLAAQGIHAAVAAFEAQGDATLDVRPVGADRLEERTADVEVGQIGTGWGYELAGRDFDAHHPQPASQRILAGGRKVGAQPVTDADAGPLRECLRQRDLVGSVVAREAAVEHAQPVHPAAERTVGAPEHGHLARSGVVGVTAGLE